MRKCSGAVAQQYSGTGAALQWCGVADGASLRRCGIRTLRKSLVWPRMYLSSGMSSVIMTRSRKSRRDSNAYFAGITSAIRSYTTSYGTLLGKCVIKTMIRTWLRRG